MPFQIPFFKSQSKLVDDKKDNLSDSAAETLFARLDYEKKQEEAHKSEYNSNQIKFLKGKLDFNIAEIDRRRDLLNTLDIKEKTYQHQANKLLQTEAVDPKKIEQNIKLSEGVYKKIEEIQSQRRHYSAEIDRLEEANQQVFKKLK